MTLSPPAGPPQFPPYPQHPAPLPPARRRGGRAAAAAGAGALVLALIAGGAWWLTRDEGALAGQPRVTDEAAGLSYAIPDGWEQHEKGDLVSAFTSSISQTSDSETSDAPSDGGAKDRDEDEQGGVVLAGRAGPLRESELKQQTERAAKSNAVFFYPDGSSSVEESRATKVSDRPAHAVTMKVDDGDGNTSRLRMTVVRVSDSRSAFLIGIAPDGTAEQDEVVAVLESAAVS
ncbi:hypothetical protein AB0M39_20855 [Streptomyces sp. NPDC051907]|uniref:hypothetical protein n=1 Tax=Streptomyces sp. NPDC051907 TaxID=3155284 RepID=UPI0034250A64